MRIAILGMGNVGGTLGRRWAEAGHAVTFGRRDAGDVKGAAAAQAMRAAVATIGTAVANAEVVVLAVPWAAVSDALAQAGDLTGKVLLDCTNPVKPDLSGLAVGFTSSGGEEVARQAAGARVVKVFNTTGAENMANPTYASTKLTMFYAGDDAGAKDIAARLAAGIGFEPVDAGSLAMARVLEPLALLWISLAFRQGLGRNFALNITHRAERPPR